MIALVFQSLNLLIVLAVIIGAIFFGWYYGRKQVVNRNLHHHPEKPIADFMEGEIARTNGNVVFAGQTLNAPLSGRQCSYYYLLIEEMQQSGKHSHWVTIVEEEKSGDVVIHDGISYAVIETNLIKTYVVQDEKLSSGFLNDANEGMEKLLNAHGIQSTNFFGLNKSIRYKEGILESGELLTVSGKGNWMMKDRVSISVPVQKILMISSPESEPVYLSDDPGLIDTK
ncbi:MAG: hypothetical protein HY064_13260 [Bacteroidetes bacterium]|nr:hypothetical protein [Bacteroidota bacterium]